MSFIIKNMSRMTK